MSGPYVSHIMYEQMPAALVTEAQGNPDDRTASKTSRAGATKVVTKVEHEGRTHRGQNRPVSRPHPQIAPSRHGEERHKTAGDLAQGSPNGVMNGAPNTADSQRQERRGAKPPVFDAAEVSG